MDVRRKEKEKIFNLWVRCGNVTDDALEDLSEVLKGFVTLKKAEIGFGW